MNIYKVLIEFLITFITIYLIYYFYVIKKCKKNKKVVPIEVSLILAFHKIDIDKINLYQMVKVVSLVTTFIISIIVTIISEFFNNTIILLFFGTLISIVVAVILYRIIGKHYERISNKDKK